jgi:heavy metal response regulator
MRVLVVEDEHKIAGFIKQGLQEEQYAVDVAFDGESALDFLSGAEYDVIVLDVMLPKKDGVEICRALRERGVRTPVLMLTARDAVEDRVRGLDSGADDYLVKPFAFAELLARLRALLRRGSATTSSQLQVGDLVLDTRTRRATRADRTVDLTAREYALLEYLMRNAGQVLSRTQIMNHLWNYDFLGSSNVVDVYVGYLRRKIDEGFPTRLLHTVRGAGYRIEEPR